MKWIILGLLGLLSGRLVAQPRYWAADHDSLQRELPRQTAPSARIGTLVHLLDLTELSSAVNRQQALPRLDELLRLGAQVSGFEAGPYRQLRTGVQQWQRGNLEAALTALRQAIELFDKAAHPVPLLLIDLAPLHNQLHDSRRRLAYFRRKLVQYQLADNEKNQAACYLVLAGSYRQVGNHNLAISHYLHAADLFKPFYPRYYVTELVAAGESYADWGNTQKALQYLQQAVGLAQKVRITPLQQFFSEQAVAKLHLKLGNVAAADRYAQLARRTAPTDPVAGPMCVAYALVLQSQVLLARRQPAAALPLLRRAQRLADSLALRISDRPGEFALDDTWARYYLTQQNYALARQAWERAYRKTITGNYPAARPRYLRRLIELEQAHGSPAAARAYTQRYFALADTLQATQGSNLVAQYESERVEQAQNEQITRLQQEKTLQTLRLQQRNRLLTVASVALALITALMLVVYRQLRINKRTLTELRQTQNRLVQSEKWAFVGEVSAGIAHELQNPLNFMKRFAEVSTSLVDNMDKAGGPGGLEQEILVGLRQNLQEISQHGIRASAIIRDMLEHARSGTGQRVATDLNELVMEYLQLARQSQEFSQHAGLIGVETDLAPDLPAVPVVAPDMGRVLLNLFTNAFYAVSQRLEAGEAGYAPGIRVDTRLLPASVQIRVSDNGPGIPEAVRQRIFTAFFTTKPVGEGTGLGLSLSHDIVTSHGGTIHVDSAEGEGAEFTITLPTVLA
ncbi:hypothetical protein KLP40_11325 [Hymenobacter sp. NST-14]|uniref:ATP-binding protein n=1 Tax=Hymenobacter piscis TaxID=2839984 RepID=UPI001C034007|nr:ATP-binding protein [Hymenobacter piscis]MBT9393755.1 hypothetical protein [Hymenobacter piscis]